MKLIFAHDHKLRNINNEFYTLGGLRDSITDRYMKYFDSLTIFCRAVEKQPYDTKLFKLCNPKITVKPVSRQSLILKKNILVQMEEEIKNADALIVKLHSFVAEYAIYYARKHNIPYLIESVGCPWDAYWNHSLKGKILAPFMTFITKLEIRRAPYVIYVTKEFLEKRYPCKGKWIDCSDVELYDSDSLILESRITKIQNNNDILVLGTLAQIDVLYKGQEYVIKALATLKKKGIIFRYKLAGSGSCEYLQRIAKTYGVLDQIEFCGVLSHDEVFAWLDNIDIYIQPSKQEGLPRAVVEALSRACPALGSNVGGIAELVGKNYIFKKGNVNQIVNLLENISKDELIVMAKDNYEKSLQYNKDFLQEKRDSFYRTFYEECKINKDVL